MLITIVYEYFIVGYSYFLYSSWQCILLLCSYFALFLEEGRDVPWRHYHKLINMESRYRHNFLNSYHSSCVHDRRYITLLYRSHGNFVIAILLFTTFLHLRNSYASFNIEAVILHFTIFLCNLYAVYSQNSSSLRCLRFKFN